MSEQSDRIAELAVEMRSMAQTGLCYDTDDYQRIRYNRYLELSNELESIISGIPQEEIASSFNLLQEYATPKLDVRGVVFSADRKILLSREKCDGCWSVPGGWSDVNETPSECAVKEVWEEAGLHVEPVKLLMLLDYRKWNSPPTNLSIYKMFILCKASESELSHYVSHTDFDILGSGFFAEDEIPPLSVPRTSYSQIAKLFEFYDNASMLPIID